MATYQQYLDRGLDAATARAWAAADADDELDGVPADSVVSPSERDASASPSGERRAAFDDVAVSELLRDAALRVGPAPHSVIGRDATGTVGVEVDEQHTPVRLDLRAKWIKAMAADALAPAILAAYSAALEIQYQDAGEVADDGNPPQVAEWVWLSADLFAPSERDMEPPRPVPSRLEDAYTAADRTARFVADMKREAQRRVDAASTPRSPRTVDLVLDGPWLVGCHVNADWAATTGTWKIMNAFSVALDHAKDAAAATAEDLSWLADEKQQLLADLHDLIRENMAALRYLARRRTPSTLTIT